MKTVSQLELLSEGFWSTMLKGAKSGIALGKQVMKTVAPEFTNPISKSRNWLSDTNKQMNDATKSLDERAFKFLEDSGYAPLFRDVPVKWSKQKNADGTIAGSIDVGDLTYGKNGEIPYRRDSSGRNKLMGDTYIRPNLVLQYNPRNKTFKIIQGPRRKQSAVGTGSRKAAASSLIRSSSTQQPRSFRSPNTSASRSSQPTRTGHP